MIRTEAAYNGDGTAMFETGPDLEPALKTERVNETRYTRTFSAAEVVEALKTKVLKETSEPSYMYDSAKVDIRTPDGVPDITLMVVVPGRGY